VGGDWEVESIDGPIGRREKYEEGGKRGKKERGVSSKPFARD